ARSGIAVFGPITSHFRWPSLSAFQQRAEPFEGATGLSRSRLGVNQYSPSPPILAVECGTRLAKNNAHSTPTCSPAAYPTRGEGSPVPCRKTTETTPSAEPVPPPARRNRLHRVNRSAWRP